MSLYFLSLFKFISIFFSYLFYFYWDVVLVIPYLFIVLLSLLLYILIYQFLAIFCINMWSHKSSLILM